MCQTTRGATSTAQAKTTNEPMRKSSELSESESSSSSSSSSSVPSPRSHDFITTLVATLNIPPYSMLLCMGLYSSLIYATIHWSLVYLRTVLILYMVHAVLLDGTAQRRTKPKWVQWMAPYWNKNFWFRLTAKYFSVKLHRPPEEKEDSANSNKNPMFDSNQAYIFAYHPHGIIGMGASLGLSTDASDFHSIFPGIRRSGSTLNVTFRVPFFRDWILMNGFCSANKKTLLSRLTGNGDDDGENHESIVLIPGGAAEALHCKPKTMRLTIKNRKGFIKLALQSKAALVPCIGFGENDIFDTFYVGDHDEQTSSSSSSSGGAGTNAIVWKLQRFLYKQFSFSTPLWTHLIPLAHPIDVVVGKPLVFDESTNIDQANVDKCHALYLKALQDLYDEHKTKYGYEDVPLEFV